MNNFTNRLMSLMFSFFLVIALLPSNAEAKKWGGGGYKSSSWGSKSKSSSSSFFSKNKKSTSSSYGGGYSSPVKKTVVKKSSVPSSGSSYGGGYNKKTAVASNSTYGGGYSKSDKPAPKTDSFQQAKAKKDRKIESKKALASYREKQSKLKESAAAKKAPETKIASSTTKKYRDSLGSSGKTYDSYQYRRASYYNDRSYQPPVYINNSGGSWGGMDGFFLGYMLAGNSHGSDYMYHHQNDPAIQSYLAEQREQAKENDELRERLHELDKEMAVMKAKGVVPQSDYVPEGIDPDMMYSDDYLKKYKDDLYTKKQADSVNSTNSDVNDEGGSTGVMLIVVLLLMGGIVWFVFFRRTLD